MRRRLLTLLLATLATFGIGTSLATAASADYWQQACTGGPFYIVGTCVDATMGGKNYSNHTQWVGWVYGGTYGSMASTVKIEVWGDGFYFAQNTDPRQGDVQSQLFGAQRWVRSGTNVCAARTRTDGWRDIACFGVRV